MNNLPRKKSAGIEISNKRIDFDVCTAYRTALKMPPRSQHDTAIEGQNEQTESNFLQVGRCASSEKPSTPEIEKKNVEPVKQKIIWFNVIMITVFHLLATYMFFAYLIKLKFLTVVWGKKNFSSCDSLK